MYLIENTENINFSKLIHNKKTRLKFHLFSEISYLRTFE